MTAATWSVCGFSVIKKSENHGSNFVSNLDANFFFPNRTTESTTRSGYRKKLANPHLIYCSLSGFVFETATILCIYETDKYLIRFIYCGKKQINEIGTALKVTSKTESQNYEGELFL